MDFKKKLIKNIVRKSSYITFDINVSDYCNYSCWYCWPGAHAGTIKLPDITETFKNNIKEYLKQTGNKKPIFQYGGGEPTLHNSFVQYCKFCKSLNGENFIVTNGSRKIRWWEKYINYFDFVSVSVHPSSCDISHLISLVDLFKKANTPYNMRVSMDPKSKDVAINILKQFVELKIDCMPLHIQVDTENWNPKEYDNINLSYSSRNDKTAKSYIMTDSSVKEFRDKDRQYMTGDWIGYNCMAAQDHVNVNPYGQAYLSCKNKISKDIDRIDLFSETKFKINSSVECEVGYCRCRGLWKSSKSIKI